MRKFKVISASLVAASSFGFAACGDDPEPGADTSAETTPETVQETTETTPEETAAETTPDAEVTNPCDGVTCGAKASTCNAEGAVVSYGAGACDEGECVYTETTSPCTGGAVCAAGACVAGGDACEYSFDKRVSYVTSIEVAGADCCFDFGGANANVDNVLGALLTGDLIKGFFDVNATIEEQIASGSLVLLLETKGVTDVANSSGVTVNGFYGLDANADLSDNASGTAQFLVNPSSFQPGTASPLISFSGASITAGTLTAGPSLFRLSIPLLGTTLDLAVESTQLEGAVAAGLNGADGGLSIGGDDGAKLGGYVAMQSLANAFNAYLDASCTCITKKDDALPYLGVTESGGSVKLASNIDKGTACTGEGEDTCGQVATYVPIAGGLISPDIDGDDDGVKESISVGVRIKATSATIEGVDGCTP